jgi:two-component sensor histidine kinase
LRIQALSGSHRESKPDFPDTTRPQAQTPSYVSAVEIDRRNSLAHAIVATVREPLIVLDRNLRVVAASRSFYRIFQKEPADTLGRPFLTTGERDELRRLLEDVISGNKIIEAYEVELVLPTIGRRRMLLNARLVLDQKSADTTLLVALEDVTARREAEDLKDALLKQRETLLVEVQHRIGNSLQIIASILLLKARNVKSEETRSHLRDAHQRLMSVATLQEQLRTSPLGENIEVGPYLSKLCASLASSMVSDERSIALTASSAEGTVNSNDAVSYGLIVTELVINALKHGFPDGRGGHVAVEFVGGKDWRLSVSDDGIGRHEGAEPTHVGLGTSIVAALAQQLNARVEILACHPGTTTSIIHAAA